MEIALSNSYQRFMIKGAHLKTCPAFTFITLGFFVEILTQNVTFPKGPVLYLACQNTLRMYKVTLIINKVHMVYTRRLLVMV